MCFIPFVALLGMSFLVIRGLVASTVRSEVHASLSQNQSAIAHIHAKSDLQNSRFLKIAGENPALKAGIDLMNSHPGDGAARRTVEDQLRELGQHMGFDLLEVSGPNRAPLAAVVRAGTPGSELVPTSPAGLSQPGGGLVAHNGQIFQIASVPIDQNEENIGALAVGELYDFSEFTTPAILLRNQTVVESNLPEITAGELNAALAGCPQYAECDIRLRGSLWISIPVQSYGEGYLLRSLENVDKATAPLLHRLNNLFLTLSLLTALMALLTSFVASRSIEKPISALISNLRNAVQTGVLPEFHADSSSIAEIRELADNYNRAAVSVREAVTKLESAYLEFIGSLANALDARDPYTAGHSWRVSQLSGAVAVAMQLPSSTVERIRIGALLHDIGKIGIADSVLQKRGRLTTEEFEIVKEHPVIGRRILEGVRGFAPFLPAVELHHENWDGSGYPHGQAQHETSIDARIIHVADAYDAMTTDRSYRLGMSHDAAMNVIEANAGTQFDPEIALVFTTLPRELVERPSPMNSELVAAG
jgi:HD-GYP domain-containing protein (c-di-GMP phosphodiesterase class II)